MGKYGYNAYRGQSPLQKALRIFLIVLLVLIVLGFVAFIYLQQYIVISSDGVYLDLPFLQENSPAPTPLPSGSPDLIMPTPEPTPTPSVLSAFHPVALPADALTDGSALQRVTDAGGDCALFDMKTDVTDLNFTSAANPIAQAVYNPQTPGLNDAIQKMNQTDGLFTVARVSCFKDAYIFLYNDTFPIRTNSDYRWTGPDTLMWISPTNPAVQDYIIQICVELAQLGFDEILLDNAGYPNQGNLHYIRWDANYDPTQFSTVIGGFYSKLSSALAEYDVALSVVTTTEAMAGTDSLTGQTPENLSIFSRLWTVDSSGMLIPLAKSTIP